MTRGPARRRRARAALGGVAALLLSVLGLAVPATSGAFTASIRNTADTAGAASRFTCGTTFSTASNSTNAYFEYRLSGSSSTSRDVSSAGNDGSFQANGDHPTGSVTATTACPNDSGSYYAPNGSSNSVQTTNSTGSTPADFSVAIWFTTTGAGGYLIGLNGAQAGNGGQYDRHVYVDSGGNVTFGIYSGGSRTVRSPKTYNDGKWHQVVATLSSTAGMSLWVDGAKVASNASYTTAQDYTGWWRIAQGPLDGWPNAPSSTYFQGGLRFAAAYRIVLSDSEIAAEYANGKPGA